MLNDGYYDDAVEKNGDHRAAGPLRGGKYSLFEAGTRVPFFVSWKGKIQPGTSDALICQLDLLSSLAALVDSPVRGPDSQDLMEVFLGTSDQGRDDLVIEATSRTALRKGNWAMIPPYDGPAKNQQVNIELGNSEEYQLYNLEEDIGQQTNQAADKPEVLQDMIETFARIRGDSRRGVEALELK